VPDSQRVADTGGKYPLRGKGGTERARLEFPLLAQEKNGVT